MTESLSRQNLGFDFESPVYRFGPLETTASNALCVPIIYGQVKAAGNKIWQSEGSTFKTLIAFGEGPISGISNVKLNDYTVSDLKITPTIYLGDGTKNVDPRVTGANNAERANRVGGLRYTAYLALTVTSGTKVTRNYMNVTADIKGKKIYTYSADGVKSTDPIYSNNPAWCILDFLTSQSGCAMSAEDDIDIQSFINSAAYCDKKINPIKVSGTIKCTAGKNVVTGSNTKFLTEVKIGETITIGSEEKIVSAITSDTSLTVDSAFSTTVNNSTTKMTIRDTRYTLNLILDQRKSRKVWLRQMLITCGGQLTYGANNKLSLIIEQDNESVQDFTPDDIIVGSEYFQTTQKEKRADILRMRYIYPTEQCARVFAIAESDTFLSDPPIIQEIEAFGVTNFKQASRLAWYYLNQANNCNKFISFKTTQIALDRTVGDVITLTSTFLKYKKKKMRIVNINQSQNGQIQIICREYNGAESARLTTSLVGDNNDLILTSVEKSSDADDITIQYVDPFAYAQPLSISVSGNDITINLATDSTGNITTTAADIKTSIAASVAASALVTVANDSGSDGTGVVKAIAKTNLAGGTVGLYGDTMGSVEPELNLVDSNNAFEVPDDVTMFQVTQYLSQVQFNWSEISGSNITYEIREGSSWDDGNSITGLTGNSFLSSLNGAGTKYYWIKAVTKYGYYSDKATGAILVVTDIPQLNVMVETNLLYSANGTFDKTFAYNGKLKLASDGTTWTEYDETWAEDNIERTYYQNGKWGCSVEALGTYTSQVYDLGALLTSIFSLNNYESYLSDSSSSITIEMRISEDNETWDDWFILAAGGSISPHCRYYQLRAKLSSPNKQQIYLSNCILTVDVPDRIEHYNSLTIENADVGYVLDFATNSQSKVSKSFNATPAIVITPEAQSGIIITGEYSVKTKDSVTIRLKNASNGDFIAGRFDCVVKGY